MIRACLLSLFLLFSLPVLAETAAEAEARKLVDMMGMETSLQQAMEQMLNLQIQQNPTLQPFRGVMMDFFQKHMSYQSLRPEFVRVYAETFTAEELKEINAFYSTTTGQKTLEKMPELMGKGAEIGAQRVQDNLGELQQMIQQEAQRLQKLAEDNPASN